MPSYTYLAREAGSGREIRSNIDAASEQAAIAALMLVVELRGPSMFARIGVMKALNRGHVREFNPSRKEPHWGRRKLARDR